MAGVDVHTHLAPDLDDSELTGPELLRRPDALLAYLDSVGLDSALVSPPPPYYRQHLDVVASRDWVARLNDGVRRRCALQPRLRPVPYLPLEHPDVSVEVYAQVRAESASATPIVTGAAGGQSARLDDPEFDILWAMLAADGAVLLLHPGTSPDSRLAPHYQENLTGNPVETTVAVSQLVFGQVATRHPGLRFVLVHCGGAVPMLAGRWRRGIATARPGLPDPAVDLDAEFRALWFDSLAHDPNALRLAVSVLGADRLVLGSDWPFPMGSSDPCADAAAVGLLDAAVTNSRTLVGAL